MDVDDKDSVVVMFIMDKTVGILWLIVFRTFSQEKHFYIAFA